MTADDTQPVQPVQPVPPLGSAWDQPAPPTLAPPPVRSAWVTTAAVVLLIVGAFSALLGLVFVIVGLAFGPGFEEMMETAPGVSAEVDFSVVAGVMTGFMVGIGLISLIWAAAHIAGGVGILGGRGWARITGIVLAVIGLLFWVLGFVASAAPLTATSELMLDPDLRELFGPAPEGMVGATLVASLLFILPFVIGYLIVLVALARNGPFFARRGAM